MNISTINFLAVFAAAASYFLIGGVWYSALFSNAWMEANGFTKEQVAAFNKPRTFIWSFIFALVMSFNLAMYLNDAKTTAAWGATAGFLAGFGWVALSIGVTGLFENRSWKYIFVNGGYQTIAFTVMGAILGAWR